MNVRPAITTSAAAVAALALAGCGLGAGGSAPVENTQPAPRVNPQQEAQTLANAQLAAARKRYSALPQPAPGVVSVAGGGTLGITSKVIQQYAKTSPGSTVSFNQTSSSRAFTQLCTGRSDIAETTRPPSTSELELCAQNGITFKTDANGNPTPIELAADAIVIATKNQSDVGGDCLKRTTVRQIFQAGSTVTNWSQLGFFNLPLHTTGRDPASDVYQLFANLVLGTQGTAGLGAVRSDYRAAATDANVKARVNGSDALNALLGAESRMTARDVKLAGPQIRAAEATASARADKRVLAQIAAENVRLARAKKVLSAARKAQIGASNAALDANAKIQAAAAADQSIIVGIRRRVAGDFAARIAAASNPGYVGVFRFTYYELYEEQLRPMEIWDPVTTIQQLQQEGIAVQTSTRQELKNVAIRQQAGGGVGKVTTLSFPLTPTTPGASYDAAGGLHLTVPGAGPVNVSTVPNCIFPSRQTITSGVYPLSVRLLAYIPSNRLQRPEVSSYLKFYLGAGQNTVQSNRLVPLDQTVRAAEYKAVTGQGLPQSLLVSGAQPLGTVGTGPVQGSASTGSGNGTGATPTPAGASTGSQAPSPTPQNTSSKSSGIA